MTNNGDVRFLLGSTEKLGTGVNVQKRLIALHGLDYPWRPSDLEQQEGRIQRQGNMYKTVKIFRYATAKTFDAYQLQILQKKREFIAQFFAENTILDKCADIDEAAMSFAQVKALCIGDERLAEYAMLENEIMTLNSLRKHHIGQQYEMETNIKTTYPERIVAVQAHIAARREDVNALADYNAHIVIQLENNRL